MSAAPTTSAVSSPRRPLVWNVPFNRNGNFTGREGLIAELQRRAASGDNSGVPRVLHGPAGVGKTQIVLEYAYRARDRFGVIWWMRADDPVAMENDFLNLRAALELEPGNGDRVRQRNELLAALNRRADWLLIFDNAPDAAAIANYLPTARTGEVIVTGRNTNWAAPGRLLSVPPFDRGESIFFLRRRLGRMDARADSLLAAGQLAQTLEDLPLALEQAAALIEQTGLSFADYLRRFEGQWAKELRSRRTPSREYPEPVAVSLGLSFDELQTESVGAADLLRLCAFFAPEPIRREWLENGAAHLPLSLSSTVAHPRLFEQTVGALGKYALATGDARHVVLQRLVALPARDRLPAEERALWSHRALNVINAAFQFDAQDVYSWPDTAQLLPHALAAVDHVMAGDTVVVTAVRLLNEIGQFLFRQANFARAQAALERAMEVGEKLYGPENPRLAAIANNLGRVLLRQGDLAGARRRFEWALSLDENAYGRDHPHVAEVLNNLGMCLVLQQNAEAAGTFERALAIYQAHYGFEHAKSGGIVNNLGYLRLISGDLDGAAALLERAQRITESAYGPRHPDVAGILNNLGDVLRLRGRASDALEHYERALAIDEAAFGPKHPDVARDVGHIGLARLDSRDLPTARAALERAVEIDQAVYGSSHPLLAQRLTDLGRCLKAMNDVDGSVACFARAAELTRE